MAKKPSLHAVSQLHPLQPLLDKEFDVKLLSHAGAIAAGDFPGALTELVDVLSLVELPITEIIGSGGGETRFTQRLRRALAQHGWRKHRFEIAKTVDGTPRESTSHEIDHVERFSAGVIACEIEWNNKDPLFDRDLDQAHESSRTGRRKSVPASAHWAAGVNLGV